MSFGPDPSPVVGADTAPLRPLLLVGNKRSGTSILVNLLNLHPRILVTHEADIVWVLYQLSRGRSVDELEAHPGDEAKGLRATLEHCGELLSALDLANADPAGVGRAFRALLRHINEYGRGEWDAASRKPHLRWVGDKKPVQHADPKVRSFILRNLPDARFLHIVRNPRYVVASMREAAAEWGRQSVPDHWRGSANEVAAGWARTEERVLGLREALPDRVHSVRLESMAERPVATLEAIFALLELDPPDGLHQKISDWVWDPNTRHEPAAFEITPRLRRLMERYDYG